MSFLTGFLDYVFVAIGAWFGRQFLALLKAAWRYLLAPPALKAFFRLSMHVALLEFFAELRQHGALPKWAISRVDRWRLNWQVQVLPKLEEMAMIPLPVTRGLR